MPRDFLADRKTLDEMSHLSRESATSPPPDESGPMDANNQFVIVPESERKKSIHPFAQLLNREDLDDCDWLEHVAFNEIEAATREKVRVFTLCCSGCPIDDLGTALFNFVFNLLSCHVWASVRYQVARCFSVTSLS
jgi:hypothetical protein